VGNIEHGRARCAVAVQVLAPRRRSIGRRAAQYRCARFLTEGCTDQREMAMRVLTALLAAGLVLGLAGCSSNDDEVQSLQSQVASLQTELDQANASNQGLMDRATSGRACIRGLATALEAATWGVEYMASDTPATPPGIDPAEARSCGEHVRQRVRVHSRHLAQILATEFQRRRSIF
jgi:hypothetical protein